LKRGTARRGNIRCGLLVLAWCAAVAWSGAALAAERSGSPSLRPPAATRTPPPAERPAADAQLPGFGKFHVVRIDRDGITPREVRVEKGSTVIWFNATPGYSSVIFNEGETLLKSTQSPTLFFLAPDGTYVSAAFGPGASASTAFTRAGTYNFFVTGLPLAERNAFARVVVE